MKYRVDLHWHIAGPWVGEIIAHGTVSDVMVDIESYARQNGAIVFATRDDAGIVAQALGYPPIRAEICAEAECLSRK